MAEESHQQLGDLLVGHLLCFDEVHSDQPLAGALAAKNLFDRLGGQQAQSRGGLADAFIPPFGLKEVAQLLAADGPEFEGDLSEPGPAQPLP